MKKVILIVVIFLLVATSVSAQPVQSANSIGSFFWNTWESIKKVYYDVTDIFRAPTNKVNYIKSPYSPSEPSSSRNVRNQLTDRDTTIEFVDDNQNYIPVTLKKTYSTIVKTDDPIYYDIDINKVYLQCSDCPVINGVQDFTAGFQYQLYVDLLNHGNTGSDAVELSIDVTDENGYAYKTTFTKYNALALPVGEYTIGPIILPTLGVKNNEILNSYIYLPPNDKEEFQMYAKVQLSKSAKVVEPGRRIVQKVTRTCNDETIDGFTFKNCQDEITYTQTEYIPEIPELPGENDLIENLTITKIKPQISGSGARFCSLGDGGVIKC